MKRFNQMPLDKNIKLVVSDMDGTLLDSNANLPPNFYELWERMQKHNIVFCAASGRQIHNMKIKFPVPSIMEKIYFVAENGAYATHKNTELIELTLQKEDVIKFRKIALKIPDTYIVLSGKKYAYIENCEPAFLEKLKSYSGHLLESNDISKIDDDSLFKFTICDLKNPLHNSLPHFTQFRENFQVECSGTKWMDITRKEATKANAIKFIQQKLNISPKETIVFGDYFNDLQMLKDCPNSYAMTNAPQTIKDACKHIAPSNENGGVAIILDKILPK